MKRVFTWISLLVLCISLFTVEAQAYNWKNMIGTWELQNFVVYGITYAASKLGADVMFVVHSDGTAVLRTGNELMGGKLVQEYGRINNKYDYGVFMKGSDDTGVPLWMDGQGRIHLELTLPDDGTVFELRLRPANDKIAYYQVRKLAGKWYVKDVSSTSYIPPAAKQMTMTIYQDGYAFIEDDGALGLIRLESVSGRVVAYDASGRRQSLTVNNDGTLSITTLVNNASVRFTFQDSKPIVTAKPTATPKPTATVKPTAAPTKQREVSDVSTTAYIFWQDSDWWPAAKGVADDYWMPIPAVVTGEGHYTVAVQAHMPEWFYAGGNHNQGAQKLAVVITDGAELLPDYYMQITDIRVDGVSYPCGDVTYGKVGYDYITEEGINFFDANDSYGLIYDQWQIDNDAKINGATWRSTGIAQQFDVFDTSVLNDPSLIEIDFFLSAQQDVEPIADTASMDKEDKITSLAERLRDASAGDFVTLGTYEQDGDLSNGKEDIEWLILSRNDSRMLVVSRYVLDTKPYHIRKTDITWDRCTLREWLNNEFLNTAFDNDEQRLIPMVTVSAEANDGLSTDPGKATQGKVFLLSYKNFKEFFATETAAQCKPTTYAVSQGVIKNANGYCAWLLRSPGFFQNQVSSCGALGDYFPLGVTVERTGFGIRPAMWIDLSAPEAVPADDTVTNETNSSAVTAEPASDTGVFMAQTENLARGNEITTKFWVLDNYEHADTTRAIHATYIYLEFLYQENVLNNERLVTAAHLRQAIDNGTVYIGAPELTSDDIYIYFYGPSVACKVTYTPSKGYVSASFIDNSTSKYRAESAVSAECQYYNEVDKGLLSFTAMIYTAANGYEEFE